MKKAIQEEQRDIEQLQKLVNNMKLKMQELIEFEAKDDQYDDPDEYKVDYDNNIYFGYKYHKHKSRREHLFRVPTAEYLRFLKCREVYDYDWIQKNTHQ